jgi:uncharacterized membrane protein YczE
VRLVRTTIEVGVLATGWLLGGSVGIGTVVYALGVGPLIQLFLRLPLRRHDAERTERSGRRIATIGAWPKPRQTPTPTC